MYKYIYYHLIKKSIRIIFLGWIQNCKTMSIIKLTKNNMYNVVY